MCEVILLFMVTISFEFCYYIYKLLGLLWSLLWPGIAWIKQPCLLMLKHCLRYVWERLQISQVNYISSWFTLQQVTQISQVNYVSS